MGSHRDCKCQLNFRESFHCVTFDAFWLLSLPADQLEVLRKAEADSRLTVMDKINESYESLVQAFIRPPRHLYDVSELGAPRFFLEAPVDDDAPLDPDAESRGYLCYRTDFEVKNSRHEMLKW